MTAAQTGRRSLIGKVGAILAAMLVAVAAAMSAIAGPAAELWPRWEAHDPLSTRAIDHSAWADFLSRYLVPGDDGISRVRYGEVTDEDRHALARYIADLGSIPIRTHNRNEQFAYWANLYNALTVRVILDHYPVGSIREINTSPGWFSRGPWGQELVEVEGARLSLDDIEHRIMRPLWRDPRIHYAVNCAALGCPNLVPEPFTGDRWDAMLEAAARDFVNHPRGARVENGRLHVSSLYHWYEEDFGDGQAAAIGHLRRYAEGDLARSLRSATRIHRHDYDWALNDASAAGLP